MNRMLLKLGLGRAGWVHTTLTPIHDKHESRFGMLDFFLLATLIATVTALARLLIAH